VGIAALRAGQDWLDANGMADIHAREMALARMLVDGLRAIDGVRVYCCGALRAHLPTISMNIEGVEACEAGARLETEHGVATRTGLHCAPLVHQQLGTFKLGGTVRFSIGPFNTEEDIQTAIRGVEEIAAASGACGNAHRNPEREQRALVG
jgi:cysteine desulfurase/selenocysteine lyase